MRLQKPMDYKLLRFEQSNTRNKKYDAILIHKTNGTLRRIPFGDSRYAQYRDQTPLHLYRHLDHHDTKRRERYRQRHRGEEKWKFSSGYFSYLYLW